MIGQIKTGLRVRGGISNFPVKFKYSISEKFKGNPPNPVSILVGRVVENKANPGVLTNAVSVDWSYSNGVISINNMPGLTDGVDYIVNLEIKSN